MLPTDRAPGPPPQLRMMATQCNEGTDYVFPWRVKERKRRRDVTAAATSKEPSMEALEYKKHCRYCTTTCTEQCASFILPSVLDGLWTGMAAGGRIQQ